MKLFIISIMAIACLLSGLPAWGAWQPAGLSGKDILTLAEDPTTTTKWFAGTGDGEVHVSTDGVNWLSSNTGLPAGAAVLSLIINPSITPVMYAGLNGTGVYKSTDSGAHWSTSGLDTLSVRCVEIDPYDTSVLYAATSNGIYKSFDVGVNWQAVTSSAIDSTDIRKIVLNPPDFSLNPLPAQTDIIYAVATGGIYKSVDSGSTWTKIVNSGNFTSIAIDPQKPTNLYAGTSDAGIYKSVDGGTTWTAINDGLGSQNIVTITIYPYSSTSILAGTATGGLYRTDTSGNTWYKWTFGNAATKVSAVIFLMPQQTSIFAGTSDGTVSFDNSLPDLVITSVSSPSSAGTGQPITATVTIKNQGGGNADTSWVALYISSDAAITTNDLYIGNFRVISLAAGAETVATITGNIPLNINGNYYMGAIADFANNWVVESNETNNAFTGSQITINSPDLIVKSVIGPSSAGTGQPITATVTIKNQGGGDADTSWVALYISSDAAITTNDLYIGNFRVISLAAGAETVATITGNIPLNINGNYYMGAIADFANNWVVESNETNNAFTGSQITINSPDLIVKSVIGPSSAGTGQPITATVTIKNQGGGDADTSWVALYLSSDAAITTNDLYIGNFRVISLAAGAETVATVTGNIPLNINGNYYMGAIADFANNWVVESNETNNAFTGSQITINPPDLIVTSVSGPSSAGTGQPITVTNTVKNQGVLNASGSYVAIYLSTDSTITTTDFLIGYRWVNGLEANTSDTAGTLATIPAGLTPGTYYIGAIADPNNFITESDEYNNSLTGEQITVSTP